MHLHDDFTHCTRRDWELSNKDVFNFESIMMSTNNVIVTTLRIMDVVFVISLTHEPILSHHLLPNLVFFLV